MFLIREIDQSDYIAFQILLIEQFATDNEQEIEQKLEDRIRKCIENKNVTVLVALDEDCIKGYVIIHWLQELWADAPEALLSSLYVGLSSRNRGIGASLLKAAINKAQELSCSRLWLENNRANPIYDKQFYKKRGWKERSDMAIFEFPPLGH